MNIALVNTEEQGGGAAKVARQLFEELPALGHCTALVVRRRATGRTGVIPLYHHFGSRRARFWGRLDRWVERRLHGRKGVYHLRQALHYLAEPEAKRDVEAGRLDVHFPGTAHLVEQLPWKPDIVHLHNLHGNYFDLRALPQLAGTAPLIWTLHDEWAYTGICACTLACERWEGGCGSCPQVGVHYRGPDATADNWLVKRRVYAETPMAVVAPSRWLLERARRSILAGHPATTFHHIPNGVDTRVFHPGDKGAARRALGLPEDGKVVLYVANKAAKSPWKDFDTLVEAGRMLSRSWTGGKLMFLVLGTGGERERQGDVQIVPVPYQSDERMVARYYQAADLYLHASRAENFSLALLEASACGLPVIATNVGGNAEIVVDGETGRLVPAQDPAAMARAAETILANDGMCEKMGKASVDLIRKSLTLEHMMRLHKLLYERVGVTLD